MYCVYVVSLHTESTDSVIITICVYVHMCECACVWMHECVCEGHTLKPAALKCALAADCKMERDNSKS